MAGERDILGLWAGDGGQGAKFWLSVLTEIKNRGTADVCIVVCDGLKGLPEAIGAVWELAIVQTSSVHNEPCRDRLGGHLCHPGQGLCKRVAFEVQTQTCPPGMAAGFASASGSCTTSAEMRFRRGRPRRGDRLRKELIGACHWDRPRRR